MMRRLLISSLCVSVILFLTAGIQASEGRPYDDLQLIRQELEVRQPSASPYRSIGFMPARGDGLISRYNPARILLGGMMYLYQGYISPQLPSECLYHTSCSAYSMVLISEFGFAKGVIATSDRLMRCNRVAALDIHPMSIHEISGKAVENPDIYRLQRNKTESTIQR